MDSDLAMLRARKATDWDANTIEPEGVVEFTEPESGRMVVVDTRAKEVRDRENGTTRDAYTVDEVVEAVKEFTN
jgi:hypothetical protein